MLELELPDRRPSRGRKSRFMVAVKDDMKLMSVREEDAEFGLMVPQGSLRTLKSRSCLEKMKLHSSPAQYHPCSEPWD